MDICGGEGGGKGRGKGGGKGGGSLLSAALSQVDDASKKPTSRGSIGMGSGREVRSAPGNISNTKSGDSWDPRGRMFKKEDWGCPTCGNTNWAKRDHCNMCGTKKPSWVLSGEEDVRQGAGGGFNERQNRASQATVEVAEDGFDDFGNRKKISGAAAVDEAQMTKAERKAAGKRAKEEAALARLNKSFGG